MLCINDVINSRWEGDGWGYIKTNSIFCSRSISYSGASIPKAKGSSVLQRPATLSLGGGISAIFVALCPKCDMVAMFM